MNGLVGNAHSPALILLNELLEFVRYLTVSDGGLDRLVLREIVRVEQHVLSALHERRHYLGELALDLGRIGVDGAKVQIVDQAHELSALLDHCVLTYLESLAIDLRGRTFHQSAVLFQQALQSSKALDTFEPSVRETVGSNAGGTRKVERCRS